MRDFHKDKARYFNIQYLTARDHIIPHIDQVKKVEPGMRVLEVGCAEAGVLKAFREVGCDCLGIELMEHRTRLAISFHDGLDVPGSIEFLNQNIYDIDPDMDLSSKFDLIILKDVIEHIPDQEKFIPHLKHFLKPGGIVFFGFPPWCMPFGGHQQIAQSKFLSFLPYYHLLPKTMYRAVLRLFGESDGTVAELTDIRDTGISIHRFEKIMHDAGMKILSRKFWLLNPIYKYKFGKGPVAQAGWIGAIPYLRDFVTTAAYYIVGSESE
jgi:SAM-dependent methyltransferase